jgi:hypothetical protein
MGSSYIRAADSVINEYSKGVTVVTVTAPVVMPEKCFEILFRSGPL